MRPIFNVVVLSLLLGLCANAQNSVKISRTSSANELPFEPALKPFYHGVASGDPLEDRLIIWTRVTPEDENDIPVKWYVAKDTGMTDMVVWGDTVAKASSDFTVKVDVNGLQPGHTYYYQFEALNKTSIIGRGKTTPSGNTSDSTLKFAVVSCANYEGGVFNAFERISERNDLDAVIHLGDYIYEYEPGKYKNASLKEANRVNIPNNEIISLADYRTRYSLYRLDHDLMKAHQQQTFITIWDDHESANDSYFDGAENHTEGTEGSWFERKAIAKKVYYEWMPIRDTTENTKLYRKISYGTLADLFMLDTRLEGREKPPVHFDTPDNGRKIISQTQYDWLINNLKNSTAQWKVIGNQLLFSTFNVGFGAPSQAITNIDSIRTVEDNFIDNWESYPLQRNSIIDTLRDFNIKNVVFVSGDSHCSWAFDVTKNARLYPLAQAFNIPQKNPYHPVLNRDGYNDTTGAGSWAVEFGTPSIASQNFDELGFSAAEIAQFEFTINNYVDFPFVGLVNYPT
ncbi:MAG: alkaline phosphatase D family protein, partial [Cytophagales bacterium]